MEKEMEEERDGVEGRESSIQWFKSQMPATAKTGDQVEVRIQEFQPGILYGLKGVKHIDHQALPSQKC